MIHGLTMGKFLPFHQGHELLIQVAASCVTHLTVLIGTVKNDPYSFRQRYEWVMKALNTLQLSCSYNILEQSEEYGRELHRDGNGTILDEDYWRWWIENTRNLVDKKIDYVFTSDAYGERVAKEFDAEWFPVDPDREIINISGTRSRNDLYNNFQYLPPYVRKDLLKTVAIVGPESTGKSVLVHNLREHFKDCVVVPEYGRTICKPKENILTKEDFKVILYGQDTFIENAKTRTKVPLVITDTEALVTGLYYNIFFDNHVDNPCWMFANHQDIDYYIVMSPDVPWVQDGERFMTETQRYNFFENLCEILHARKKNYTVIWGNDYQKREKEVISYIKHILTK